MPPKPPLTKICDWPADPRDITPELAAKLFETGDVKGVLSDMVRLTSQLHDQRTTHLEATVHAQRTA